MRFDNICHPFENPDLVTHVKNDRSCSHSFWWVWVLLVKPNIFRGFYGPKRLVWGFFEAYVSYRVHMSAEKFVHREGISCEIKGACGIRPIHKD